MLFFNSKMNPKVLILILSINLVQSYFDVQMDRFEVMEQDTRYTDWSEMKIRKVSKVRSLIGHVKIEVPVGNNVLVEGKAYKKQGGEYRLMPYHVSPLPLCDYLGSDSMT